MKKGSKFNKKKYKKRMKLIKKVVDEVNTEGMARYDIGNERFYALMGSDYAKLLNDDEINIEEEK